MKGYFASNFQTYTIYEQRIQALGIQREINRARLKDKILNFFPIAQELSDGKLSFEQGIQQMLKQSSKSDCEGEVLLFAEVAKILRSELASFNGFQFDGCFTSSCQQESVPSALKTFVSMLLNDVDLKNNDCTNLQTVLTVSLTILSNYTKKPTSSAQHSPRREPPLPLFIGLKVHTKTRSKKMITNLYNLGLNV